MSVLIRLGDCLKHENKCIIAHCCNDVGGFDSGFVASLNKVSPSPRAAYKKWYKEGYTTNAVGDIVKFELGNVQYVCLQNNDKDKVVANIIGQHSMGWDRDNNRAPIRYWAIRKGLQKIKQTIDKNQLTDYNVVSPLLGCALAGGELDEIYAIIHDIFSDTALSYYLYAFTQEDFNKLDSVAKISKHS